ncbi:MAG TPA: TonB-dependent receptor plug domain-containing protein, partial [Polyangiaceae bacterium]|nr:TonB-dependent receptor plug domain-containing protein [Polyangiaceae bacterium]
MKNGEARGLDSDQRRTGGRKLRSQTGWAASLLARTTYARRTGVACALWASAGWAQQPPPTNPPPAAPDTAAPTGAAPAPAPDQAAPPPAPGTPPSAAAPGTEPPAVPGADALDDSSLEPGAPAAPLPGTPAAKASANGGLEEVVVTVDRRQKNLQEYSGTAAAFSQSQLTNVGINNVQNLSQEVPGLQIGINDQGSSTVYIRGIGSDNTTELGDPSVAVHIDNVYLPRVRGMNAAFLDVQRVEVNSGPQGTLRGRNATGGSINIVSNPAVLGEYQGSAEMTLGTYRRREFQGMLNIPLGDHLALRVAGSSSSVDPTWVNDGPLDYLPGAQSTDDYAMKGQLRFKPNSKLDMVLAGDYTLQRGLPYLGANMANLVTFRTQNGTPNDLSDDTYAPIDPNSVKNPRRVYQRGRYPSSSLEHWGVRYDGNYDAGPMTFELLGSYRWQNWNLHGGSTAGFFVDQNAYQIPNQQWDNWSFAQQQNNNSGSYVGEFRIASHENQRLVWSVGLFGFHEKQGAFLGQVTGDPGGFNEFNMPSTIGS